MKTGVKKDYIWNTVAGCLKAGETVFMTMLASRLVGLAPTGIITVAFAVGNQLLNIGKFGARNYQVTDTKNQFPWKIYLLERLISVVIMLICMFFYLVYVYQSRQYSYEKLCSIVLVGLIFAVEAIEDVFWGLYQKKGHITIGAQMFCIRWSLIFVSYAIVLWTTRNMVYTLIVCLLCSIVTLSIMVRITFPKITGCKVCFEKINVADWRKCLKLQRATLPVFVMEFCSLYIGNAPKYAIDRCMNDEVQACYGFVAMPIFVIGLLNTFIYQPTLVQMATEWQNNKMSEFKKRIKRQVIIVICIAITCLTGAYFIGIPVLSLLFATNLMNYKKELIILLLAGMFYAISGYLGIVITIMRRQKVLVGIYGIVALIALLFMTEVVSAYGTMGAAIGHLGLMILLCVSYIPFLGY